LGEGLGILAADNDDDDEPAGYASVVRTPNSSLE
jgi:hypothetical protein